MEEQREGEREREDPKIASTIAFKQFFQPFTLKTGEGDE